MQSAAKDDKNYFNNTDLSCKASRRSKIKSNRQEQTCKETLEPKIVTVLVTAIDDWELHLDRRLDYRGAEDDAAIRIAAGRFGANFQSPSSSESTYLWTQQSSVSLYPNSQGKSSE